MSQIPSNEEIINELTEGIESQFIINPEDQNTSNEIPTKNNVVPENFDHSDTESTHDADKPPLEDDYIDEVALKDAEINLTDEEKERRHSEALQLKSKGNTEFKEQKYLESIQSYTEALRICPLQYQMDRSVFYANRAASKMKVDRTKSAIDDCSQAIELNDKYVRAYLRRAKLYEDTEKLDEGLEDYKKVLELDPGNPEAMQASVRLPPLISERNEKLKTEMFGKLKDLGNMFLRPFGLSTENFQLQEQPSGGYSVNFQQNPGS